MNEVYAGWVEDPDASGDRGGGASDDHSGEVELAIWGPSEGWATAHSGFAEEGKITPEGTEHWFGRSGGAGREEIVACVGFSAVAEALNWGGAV